VHVEVYRPGHGGQMGCVPPRRKGQLPFRWFVA
jgi:hypothetical protein